MGAFGVLDIQRSEQYIFLYSAYLGVVYSLWAIRPYTSPTKGRACILFIPVIDLMNIILAFDHSSTTIFVPDGYVSDVEHLRACFFDWLYDNPQYMTCDEKGHAVCAYDAMAFLAYINQVILRSSNEKAYVIPAIQTRGKLYRLEF